MTGMQRVWSSSEQAAVRVYCSVRERKGVERYREEEMEGRERALP